MKTQTPQQEKFRSAYGPKLKVTIDTGTEGGAKQAFKEECNINNILARYAKTGVLEHAREHGGQYGFATAIDFQTAMEIVAQGNSMFEELPSHIRNRFDNDPAEFLDFVQDENNVEEMRELGLLHEQEEVPSVPTGENETRGTETNKGHHPSEEPGRVRPGEKTGNEDPEGAE